MTEEKCTELLNRESNQWTREEVLDWLKDSPGESPKGTRYNIVQWNKFLNTCSDDELCYILHNGEWFDPSDPDFDLDLSKIQIAPYKNRDKVL